MSPKKKEPVKKEEPKKDPYETAECDGCEKPFREAEICESCHQCQDCCNATEDCPNREGAE